MTSRVRMVCGTLIALGMGALGGCATAPPVERVDSVKSIAGKWAGELADRGGAYPITITIRDDGSWEGIVLGQRFRGTAEVLDGRIRLTNHVTGAAATYTLYQEKGKRVLKGQRDDGGIAGELRQVP